MSPAATANSVFLWPVTEAEITRLLQNLSNNTAAGSDNIKAAPIKAITHFISSPLEHICNTSLLTGIFPEKMKLARVCVIHKGGPRNNINNYRPISVLPLFSKILEQVINVRLSSYLEKNNIIVKQQYGFQKNKSTEKALLYMKDTLINSFENKLYTVGIFWIFARHLIRLNMTFF